MGRALQEEQVTVEMLQSRNAQIREQLEVATIQKLILTTIIQSQDVNLDAAKMDALSFTLMNVSELYNEFACPLNLFNVCLLILETCRHNDYDSIRTLWKSIICEEILPCQTNSEAVVDFLSRLKHGSMLEEETIFYGVESSNNVQQFENGEWITRLRNRVTALGKELHGKGADYTFPLDLIVMELEGRMKGSVCI
jgi:nuclear pore complex protein Nup155